MLNIMVLNCEDVFVEYQWVSTEVFLSAMKSDKEEIPMPDDSVVTLDIGNKSYNEEMLRCMGIYDISDAVAWCHSFVI